MKILEKDRKRMTETFRYLNRTDKEDLDALFALWDFLDERGKKHIIAGAAAPIRRYLTAAAWNVARACQLYGLSMPKEEFVRFYRSARSLRVVVMEDSDPRLNKYHYIRIPDEVAETVCLTEIRYECGEWCSKQPLQAKECELKKALMQFPINRNGDSKWCPFRDKSCDDKELQRQLREGME